MGSNCYYCGKKLVGDEKVCPYCDRKQSVDEELVNAAKQGDQQAFTEIYMLSQQNVYIMVRSMVKDPDTVEDIVQDTFIKVYENLSSLNYEEGKFQAWVRRIAHNTTVNYVKKRKEVLFSEMEGDDSEGAVDFEDERGEHLPEVVIDQKETTRLIDEMLDTLTEDQRLVVGMYYYEQKSVNEIAETLGISVNTVKSRMSYGRKKVEMQVRALEKQGTKLYGLSPIPFLMLLFRNQEAQAAAPDAVAAEKAVGAIMAAKTALEAAGQGGAAAAQSVAAAQTPAVAGSGGTAASTAAQSSEAAGQGAAASQSAAGSQAASHGAAAAGNTASSAGKAATATGKAAATAGKTTAALGKSIAIKATAGVLAVGLAGGAVFYASNRKPEEEIGTETEIVLATETEESTEVIEVETETETETETIVIIEETETETEEEFYYTFTSMNCNLFVLEESDVLNLPEWNGELIGTLSVGDIIEITGQCNETEWYQISYNGSVGYVWNLNVLDYSVPNLCEHSNWIEFYNDENSSSTSSAVDSDDRVHYFQEEPENTYWYMCEECSITSIDKECDHEFIMAYTNDGIYEGTCGDLTYTIYEDTFYYVCEKCGAHWFY